MQNPLRLKKIDEDILELMIETNCTRKKRTILNLKPSKAIRENMIAWQVRVKNIMKTDALGQKDNHSLVTSLSSSLRLPKIQFQQFSGELTDWLRDSTTSSREFMKMRALMMETSSSTLSRQQLQNPGPGYS
ncbi:hypothetical protein TNCV_3458721 [Trichonephila clavipes]|nr:hypothetical protein TNCV_3458721 [Trichonephila clavipes]